MGYETHSTSPQGGPERDESDHAHLRHGRDQRLGFPVGKYLQPPPMLFTRDGHNLFLGDVFRGRSAFLVCAGPSLNTHDLQKLQQRGILTCAVNNAAAVIRPNLWVSVDDPGSFSDAIWRDPGIWKFVPLCHMEKTFTTRDAAGELVPTKDLVGDMPCVFGYRRNEAFIADQWLHEDTFNWGNHSDHVDALGIKGSRSVMLVALRMMFYLGLRRIYLLGCDFRMAPGVPNYAFDQDRSRSSISGNNSTYEALNIRLGHLKPYFEQEGFEVFNCTPDSGLRVFPYRDYELAVQEALERFPTQIVTAGMYDRKAKERKKKKAKPSPTTSLPPSIPTAGNQADIVESLDLPPMTLVTAVDRSSLDVFRWTWQTWMLHRGWLKTMPVLLIYDRSENLIDELQQIVRDHGAIRFIGETPGDSNLGRDRWSQQYLHVPARHVRTPWYLRLEPETVACRADHWLRPEWFQPNNVGRTPAFISHAWGYTKPADVFKNLDDWGDGIEGLQKEPPLKFPVEPNAQRIMHEAISSWIFLGNTAWTQELAAYVPNELPCRSHDTFTLYCALRRKDPFVRWPMKSLGWDHSFARKTVVIDQCREILSEAVASRQEHENGKADSTPAEAPAGLPS